MDGETLFYIVAILIYLAFQALGGKKKKKKRPLPGAAQPLPSATNRPAQAPGAEPTLEDALRDIRQALGMEMPAQPASPPPTAEPPTPPASRPAPKPRSKERPVRTHAPELAETAPQKSWPSEFQAYPTHYADSHFEELTTDGDRFGKPRTRQIPRRPALKTPPVKKTIASPKPAPVDHATLIKQLQDPQSARDAFVLSEIFGRPHPRRR